MPDLTGMKLSDAQIVLRNSGFAPARVRFVEAYAPEDLVVGQTPARGMLVERDSTLELRIAKPSLVRFLPGVYQLAQDDERNFLRDFLWIFHHILDGLRHRIDDVPRLLRPLESDPDMLPWLATWLALQLDLDWPEVKRRKWLHHAPRLFSIRGTRRALSELLAIYVGVAPRIEENSWPYKGFRIGISSSIGIDSVILPPMNLAHCFLVHIPIGYGKVSEEMVVRIHRVIQAEKPAHTTYFLTFESESEKVELRDFMQIGVSSAIGTTE